MGVYQSTDRTVQIVNAGHLPVLIMDREGRTKPRLLPANDPPVGIIAGSLYTLSEVISLQNKSLYLYSDGVTESVRPDMQMLEIDGLVKLIQEHSAQPATQRLASLVDILSPSEQLHDDITLLLLEPR